MARGMGLDGIAVGMASAQGSILPPWLFPPERCRVVDLTTELPELCSAGGLVEVLAYEVPDRLTLTVRGIGFGSADPTDCLHATWTVKVGGEVLEGYHYLPATIGHIDDLAGVHMLIEPGKRFSIEVTNGSQANDAYYSGRIFGWLYDPASPRG